MEECLSRNLQARCNPLVTQVLDTIQTELTGDGSGSCCPVSLARYVPSMRVSCCRLLVLGVVWHSRNSCMVSSLLFCSSFFPFDITCGHITSYAGCIIPVSVLLIIIIIIIRFVKRQNVKRLPWCYQKTSVALGL